MKLELDGIIVTDLYTKIEPRIRLRKTGGYLIIPNKFKVKGGDVVEVIFFGVPTKSGSYTITTTVQTPPSVYLRKLDLRCMGILDDCDRVILSNLIVYIKLI